MDVNAYLMKLSKKKLKQLFITSNKVWRHDTAYDIAYTVVTKHQERYGETLFKQLNRQLKRVDQHGLDLVVQALLSRMENDVLKFCYRSKEMMDEARLAKVQAQLEGKELPVGNPFNVITLNK